MALNNEQRQTIEAAVRTILETLGEDVNRPGLLETPKRVAKMYEEVFSGLVNPEFDDYKVFDTVAHDEMVIVKDIQFYSMCEHHLLPFWGKAHVAYIPEGGKVLGLSKLARLVEDCAARPHVQEELTVQIGDRLSENIPVKGVAVMCEAEHMCMMMRGVKTPHSTTKSYYFSGEFKEDRDRKVDFLRAVES